MPFRRSQEISYVPGELESLFADQMEISDQISSRPSNAIIIEGYATLWDEVDLRRDMFRRGAFTESLKMSQNTHGVLMHWQHTERRPIGRWSVLKEDSLGLFVRGSVYPRLTTSSLLSAIRNQRVKSLSLGFYPGLTRKIGAIRVIEKAYLSEISLGENPILLKTFFRIMEK